MILQILLIIAALAVSCIAEFFSIYGLAHTIPFAMNSMIILGVSLGLSKLVVASFMYRYWDKLTLLFKTASITLMLSLMSLTSIGVFGYLHSAYQNGAIDGKEISQKVELLTEQKTQYEKQIVFIDNQIEKSPEKFVSKKIELIKVLQKDRQNVVAKLEEVNTERNKLLNSQISTDAKLGPITFVAKAFGLPVENAIAYLIGLIMIVVDPLAIYLTVAFNIVSKHKKNDKEISSLVSTLETTVDTTYDDLRTKVDNIDDSHPRKQNIIANSRII